MHRTRYKTRHMALGGKEAPEDRLDLAQQVPYLRAGNALDTVATPIATQDVV